LLLTLTDELSITSIILGIGPFIALLVIWGAFPETKGRELEEISGEVVLPVFGPPPALGSEPLSLELADGPVDPPGRRGSAVEDTSEG
jgi:hypothetical protein